MKREDTMSWLHGSFGRKALPGIVFTVTFWFSACTGAQPTDTNCPPGTGGAGGSSSSSGGTGGNPNDGGTGATGQGDQPPGGTFTSSLDPTNTFDHFNHPGQSGQKDPFEILKQRAEEGPPEIRTRLHSCSKIPYAALGDFLASRGVDLAKTSGAAPDTAGELYKNGGDALGIARFDAREGETYFHTTAGATKLFDIFVQASPEIIANIQNADACKINGVGKPMFDPDTGKCVYESLSCIMGRPATEDDLTLCDLMLAQASPGDQADLNIKRNIVVASFLAAAHTCE